MPRPPPSLPPLPAPFEATASEQIASLWSNYGAIHRIHLTTAPHTLILKTIHPPPTSMPDESHTRKLLSYAVERTFYHTLAPRVPRNVHLAAAHSLPGADGDLLLEDLARAFPCPARGSLARDGARCVLAWLAGFHGAFFRVHVREELRTVPPPLQWAGEEAQGVWARGTYWYLDTRREELAEMDEEEYAWLVPWVEQVDGAIRREIEKFGTLVHGDAKGANIVFSRDPYPRRGAAANDNAPLRCALYDFQYVGLGLPALDLVYFLGTSVEAKLLRSLDDEKLLLHEYFEEFQSAAAAAGCPADDCTFETFWTHWELAIVDWCRFMAGWGFWGNDRWVERRAKEVVGRWKDTGFPL